MPDVDPFPSRGNSVGRARLRVVQVHQVQEVERFAPELDSLAVRQADGLEQRDVPVLEMRTADRVPAGVPEGPRRRAGERGRVEPEIDYVGWNRRCRLVDYPIIIARRPSASKSPKLSPSCGNQAEDLIRE